MKTASSDGLPLSPSSSSSLWGEHVLDPIMPVGCRRRIPPAGPDAVAPRVRLERTVVVAAVLAGLTDVEPQGAADLVRGGIVDMAGRYLDRRFVFAVMESHPRVHDRHAGVLGPRRDEGVQQRPGLVPFAAAGQRVGLPGDGGGVPAVELQRLVISRQGFAKASLGRQCLGQQHVIVDLAGGQRNRARQEAHRLLVPALHGRDLTKDRGGLVIPAVAGKDLAAEPLGFMDVACLQESGGLGEGWCGYLERSVRPSGPTLAFVRGGEFDSPPLTGPFGSIAAKS